MKDVPSLEGIAIRGSGTLSQFTGLLSSLVQQNTPCPIVNSYNEMVISENSFNDFSRLSLAGFPLLKTITIRSDSFKWCDMLNIDGWDRLFG